MRMRTTRWVSRWGAHRTVQYIEYGPWVGTDVATRTGRKGIQYSSNTQRVLAHGRVNDASRAYCSSKYGRKDTKARSTAAAARTCYHWVAL